MALGVAVLPLMFDWTVFVELPAAFMGIHLVVVGLTAWPDGPSWEPVFRPTPARIWGVRLALLFLLGQLVLSVWAASGGRLSHPVTGFDFIGSLLLLTSVYVAAHWALRPETFLPKAILFLGNPVVNTFRALRERRRNAQRAERRRAARLRHATKK
jgi:hypothetical protein